MSVQSRATGNNHGIRRRGDCICADVKTLCLGPGGPDNDHGGCRGGLFHTTFAAVLLSEFSCALLCSFWTGRGLPLQLDNVLGGEIRRFTMKILGLGCRVWR